MNTDRQRQRDIERNEEWLHGLETPGPSAETLNRVKLTVRQAGAGVGDEPVPGIDEAVAAAKTTVRAELDSVKSETSSVLSLRRWAPVTAIAAVVGFALIGNWRGFVAGEAEDIEIQRLASVMDRDLDATDLTLAELAMDIANLEEDASGTAGLLWNESLLDGLGDALDDLLYEPVDRRETS